MSAKGRRKKSRMGREELQSMHARVKAYCAQHSAGPGTEPYSLLCSLGASLGVYPRVRKSTITQTRRRFNTLLGGQPERIIGRMRGRDVKARPNNNDLRANRPAPPEPTPEPLRCERCSREVSADGIECLYGDYWVCPPCAKQLKGLSAAVKEQNKSAG